MPACGQAVGAREDSCNVVAEADDKDTDTSDGIRPIMDQDLGCIILEYVTPEIVRPGAVVQLSHQPIIV